MGTDMPLPDEVVEQRVKNYCPPFGPTATQKPYDSNNVYYMEDRVRWLEVELKRACDTIEALCAVFQRISK